MYSQTKYLSHTWNSTAMAKIKNLNIYSKVAEKNSTLNTLGYVVLSVVLIATAAGSMRIIESNLLSAKKMHPFSLSMKVASAAETTNQAELTYQSHESVNIKPNEAFTFDLSFKNTGTSTWTKESVYLKSKSTALKFRHTFWPTADFPAQLREDIIEPGETGTFRFALQAPEKFNEYKGEFMLVRDNTLIKGGQVEVSMNVVEDPATYISQKEKTTEVALANNTTTTNNANDVMKDVCTLKLNMASLNGGVDNVSCVDKYNIDETGPDIRVGIFYTDNFITIKNTKAWQVYDDNDILLASVPANTEIQFNYINAKGEYVFDFIDRTVRTKTNLNLKNFNDGIFTVVSLNDIPSWNKTLNYNQFKGDFKLAYYAPKDRTWLIEITPLEEYLKGMKETSEGDPIEYQKAMTVAARTYALYHLNKFKIEDSFFDVYPDERDQVYKGYVAEQIMPNQVNAVQATNGIILTYDDAPIIAYYSARSGGQTQSNGIPYLASVETPYSAEYAMWGHGKGIDQVDARERAKQLNWTYDEILNYYYKDIDIEKIY